MKTVRPFFFASLTIALLFVLQACNTNCLEGSGKEATETRNVAAFTKLDIAGNFNVTLVQDSSNVVTINADDNVLSIIKTKVSGDELKISTDNKNVCSGKQINITVGVGNLKSMAASGAVEIASKGRLALGDLELDLSGATKLDLDVAAANIDTEASGVSEVSLKGQARSHNVEFSGSGKLHAFDLVTGNYSIETSGQSDCEVNVLNELNIHSTGASDIKYKGSPAKINKSKTGALTLTKVD